jgi:hypothetical protein
MTCIDRWVHILAQAHRMSCIWNLNDLHVPDEHTCAHEHAEWPGFELPTTGIQPMNTYAHMSVLHDSQLNSDRPQHGPPFELEMTCIWRMKQVRILTWVYWMTCVWTMNDLHCADEYVCSREQTEWLPFEHWMTCIWPMSIYYYAQASVLNEPRLNSEWTAFD